MKTMNIYAIKIKNGRVLSKTKIGRAQIWDDRISARKYNELMREANKITCYRQEYIKIIDEDGREAHAKGYLAGGNVIFK